MWGENTWGQNYWLDVERRKFHVEHVIKGKENSDFDLYQDFFRGVIIGI